MRSSVFISLYELNIFQVLEFILFSNECCKILYCML